MAKFSDATGWKRGAGPYSRSYLKTERETLLTSRDPIQGGAGKHDILDRVEANSAKGKMSESSLPGGPGGFSGEVSRGKRPAHHAGKRSYKRV